MADNLDIASNNAPSANPFDQIGTEDDAPIRPMAPDSSIVSRMPAPDAPVSAGNPFGPIAPDQGSSATGAFARGAERGALPSAGGLVGASFGAEAGGAIGLLGGPLAPITAPAGAFIGGVAGALGGGYATEKAQDYALSKAPDTWKEAIGQDDRQQQLDAKEHPYASFLGGMAPYALTMRPGGFTKGALADNATSFQRLMAHPVTARLFGGAMMGGMEAGQELAEGEHPDWAKIGISTGFGMVFNRPTKFGEALTEAGARPIAAVKGGLSPAPAVDRSVEPPVTVVQAGDAKVMGPGITEDVFHGAHEQDPDAEAAAQQNARTEDIMFDRHEPPDPVPVARQMEPELFEQWDMLNQRRDSFRALIEQHNNPPDEQFAELASQREALEARLADVPTSGAGRNLPEARRLRAQIRGIQAQETDLQGRRDAFAAGQGEDTLEAAIARQHLATNDYAMRDLGRQVSAAYRRAAEAISGGTVPPLGEPMPEPAPAAPEPFKSLAEAIAKRDEQTAPAPETAPSTSPTVVPLPPSEGEGNAVRTPEQQRATIASDVARRLMAAGRPEEEALASGNLLAARYEARATRMGGALGTPEELYANEGASIRGPNGKPLPPVGAAVQVRARGTGPRNPNAPPQSLVAFLRAAGGLKDDGGDLRAADMHRQFPGLVNKRGLSLDRARELAAEAGYLGADTTRAVSDTSVNDLLEALDRHPVYSVHDEKRLADIQDAAEKRRYEELAQSSPDDLAAAYDHQPVYQQTEYPEGFFDGVDYFQKKHEWLEEDGDFFIVNPRDPDSPLASVAALTDGKYRLFLNGREHDFRSLDGAKYFAEEQIGPPAADYVPTRIGNVFFDGDDVSDAGKRYEAVNSSGEGYHYHAGTGETLYYDSKYRVTKDGTLNALIKNLRIEESETGRRFEDLSYAHQGEIRSDIAGDMRDSMRDELDTDELYQGARGKIRFVEGQRPVITLMRDANASTFIHETGHQWLEELMSDAAHPAAPDDLKTDAQTVRDWLGAGDGDLKTRHHEKFARGFEQYMREGIAPSPQLAGVFAKFRNWLLSIYQTIKGLGQPINEDIRGVFDRMLSADPQRTVIAPEHMGGPSLADVHAADAAETDPSEADPALDRVVAERDRALQELAPEVQHELETEVAKTAQANVRPDGGSGAGPAQPGGEIGVGSGGRGEVVGGGGEPDAVAGGGARGDASPEVEPSDGDAGAESDGLRGPGDGRSGRTGDRNGPGLAPSPSALFGPAESPLVDKAGNIRLDTLTDNEDVKDAIREAAAANDDFIGDRRGVVTDGQVSDLADALGMDSARLSKRKIGQAFNAEQVVAARRLLIQSATAVSDAMKKAAIGTDEDVMAYAMAKDRHQMIQAQVAGITAEAGRALRAFRSIASETSQEAAQADLFIRQATGKTLFQLREEAKLGSSLDTPQKVSKFMDDAKERTFGRMVLEYWINGLISGPATHTTYAIGNTLLALHKMGPETAAAAGIGAVRASLGRDGDRVRLGEVGAQLRGARAGLAPAVQASIDAFRTGVTTELPGEDRQFGQASLPLQPGSDLAQAAKLNEDAGFRDAMGSAFGLLSGAKDGIVSSAALLAAGGVKGEPLFAPRYSPLGSIPDFAVRGVTVAPVGSVVRAPGRFIAAIHSFFRSMNYAMEKNAQAYRMAAGEGLDGDALAARVGALRQNPPEALMESARDVSTQLTLMGQGSEFVRQLGKLTNTNIFGFPLLKFIDPFVHIAGNVIDQSVIQRTPVGLFSPEVRADLSGANGAIAQDKTMAKMLVGTAMSITFGGLAAQGLISGSGPDDKPGAQAMWRLAGNQAHSVRIGDMWYDVHRLGPLGMLMGISADLYEVAHLAEQGEMTTAAAALQHAYVQNIFDESFMKGPADLIKAVEDPGRYGEGYIKNFLSSFVPFSVGMGQIARATDPYSRQARSVADAVRTKVPGVSEGLYPRRDVWGEPIPNQNALLAKGLTAIYETHVGTDPVNGAMLRLGIYPATLERKVRNVQLSDGEYDDFQRIAGRMAKMRLDMIVRSPDYGRMPANIQHDVLSEVIKQSRETARGIVMMKYPHIVRDATMAKVAKAQGPHA